jgi:hypothetical protein
MEARVMRLAALLATACLIVSACDEDPARSVKIIDRPVVLPQRSDSSLPESTGPKPESSPKRPATIATPSPAAKTDSTKAVPVGSRPISEWEWRPELCPPPPEQADGPSTLVVTGPCAFQHKGAMECKVTPDDFIVQATRPGALDTTMSIYVNVEGYTGPGTYQKSQILIGLLDAKFSFRWVSDTVPITVAPDEQSLSFRATRLEILPPFEAADLRVSGRLSCRLPIETLK